ncbi:MAG: GNAT family N-acetyltransferase [Butyrivibrio sp.]|nr:GNAT family N-acetyltransferase [Butyrivibrio sp.]MBR1640980.1 GNAT family N-acetyltransferase [Butyrivibrio sp.]
MKITEQKYLLPNGEEAIIRSAGSEDAMKVKLHRELTAAETHFMAREPEDGPMNLERIAEGLKSVEDSERDFMVSAFVGDELVGDLGVTLVRPHVKYLHRAYLGMSIKEKYTGMGLGSFMMKVALDQAKKNGFEQVELGVFSDNDRARHMYEKMGFKEFGMNPRAFKLKDGTYRDEIIMVNCFEQGGLS